MSEKGDYVPMMYDDIVAYYEVDPKEYTQVEKYVIITLAHLVKKGQFSAWRTPSGKVEFQAKSPNTFFFKVEIGKVKQ